MPATGNRFTLINNDTSSDSVGGTFASLPEGKVVSIGGSLFQISYQGGDGNDVVLTALSATNPVLEGTPGGDTWLVEQDTPSSGIVDVFLNGNLIYSAPIASLSTLTIDALAGNDSLTVDYVNGDPLPSGGLSYDGGSGTNSLAIDGTGLNSVYTPDAATSGQGTLAVSGTDTISFTSVTPLDYNVSGGLLVLKLPNANDVVSLDDGLLQDGTTAALAVSGTSGGIIFASPHIRGSSLTVDATAGAGPTRSPSTVWLPPTTSPR